MTVATKAASKRIREGIAASELSQVTKDQYISRLDVMAEMSGHGKDIWAAIISHKQTIDAVMEKYKDKPASQHLFASSVLAAFKRVPALQGKAPEALAAWRLISEEVQKPLRDRVLSSQPTPRQAEGYVPWEDIIKMRDAQPCGSDAALLLSMYSLIAPRRSDFDSVRIYPEPPPEGTTGNYMVIPARGRAYLMLTEYKTARKYHAVSEDLPNTLVAQIRASLKSRQKPESKEYLFVAPSTGLPHKSGSAFSQWANALLRRTFHTRLTLTLLRHSHISALSFGDMTGAEREEKARLMGHSVLTQMSYNFVSKPKDTAEPV